MLEVGKQIETEIECHHQNERLLDQRMQTNQQKIQNVSASIDTLSQQIGEVITCKNMEIANRKQYIDVLMEEKQLHQDHEETVLRLRQQLESKEEALLNLQKVHSTDSDQVADQQNRIDEQIATINTLQLSLNEEKERNQSLMEEVTRKSTEIQDLNQRMKHHEDRKQQEMEEQKRINEELMRKISALEQREKEWNHNGICNENRTERIENGTQTECGGRDTVCASPNVSNESNMDSVETTDSETADYEMTVDDLPKLQRGLDRNSVVLGEAVDPSNGSKSDGINDEESDMEVTSDRSDQSDHESVCGENRENAQELSDSVISEGPEPVLPDLSIFTKNSHFCH